MVFEGHHEFISFPDYVPVDYVFWACHAIFNYGGVTFNVTKEHIMHCTTESWSILG